MLTMYPGMVNSPITELAAAIDDVQTTITVVDGTKLPDAPNLAIIGLGEDAETILYTEKTGNVLSGVVRGFQGVAKAWGQGARIARFFTEYDQRAMMQNIQENADNLVAHLNEKVTDEFGVHGLKIEEGLWTPSLIGNLVAGSHSYVTRYGFYRRVGNQVFIYFHIHLQNKDNAMDGVAVGIEGLPFVVSDVSIGASVTIGAASYIDLSPGYTQLTGEFPTLSTRLYLRQIGSGLEGIYLPPAGVKDTSILIGSGAYLIL